MKKTTKSSKSSKPVIKPAPDESVEITLEVEPAVATRLRILCRFYNLPFPEGIGIVLDRACDLVGKKRKQTNGRAKS